MNPVRHLISYADLIKVRDVMINGKLILLNNGEIETKHKFKKIVDIVEMDIEN